MTIDQIHNSVSSHRPVSRRTIIRYLAGLGLEPIGKRKRPQQFADFADKLIMADMGITPSIPAQANGTAWKTRRSLVTAAELRNERKKGRGK